jgi:hypothetical protein
MAKKGVSVGVEITGDAKSFKKAAEDAAKATAELKRQANAHAKETEQSFKMTTIALAKVAGAVVVAKEGFEIYAKVMNSTEGTAEKLELQISLLDGAMSGLMRTVATGSWDSLISNIKRTATATRDAKEAMQEFEHASAGRGITRGALTLGLQEARVSNAETTDPTEKKKFLEQAIDYQKQLTALNVGEISERLKIDEDYYKAVTGHSKEYFDYFLKMVPTLAQNYEHYFGKNSVALEGIRTRLSALSYDAFPNEAVKSEINQLKALQFVLEDYITIQDDFSKKGQWDNYIKGIGEMGIVSAEGEKALVRLTTQLTKADTAVKKAVMSRTTGPAKIGNKTDVVAALIGGGFGKDKLAPDIIPDVTKGLGYAETAVEHLSKSFDDMFTNIGGGFKGMVDAMVSSLEKLAAQLIGKAALYAVLQLIFPGSDMAVAALSNLRSFVGTPGYANGTNFAPGGLSLVGERGPELVNLPRGSQVIPGGRFGEEVPLRGLITARDIQIVGELRDNLRNSAT